MTLIYRKNESPRTWFRSERIFRSNGEWYFHTSEGIDVGPLRSEFEAQIEPSILKNLRKGKLHSAAVGAIKEFILDVTSCP